MRKVNKLAAAVAMALSLGAMSQANAIELKHNGKADTLLFPAFNGYGENYFTVMNNANAWVQGHIRFRGAAWSGELLDFDVILSPGDVFVFRLADVDGDGYWEIDQKLDPKNFAYTGMQENCGPDTDKGKLKSGADKTLPGSAKNECMNQRDLLIPPEAGNITAGLIEHQRHVGYVEFIGEGIFLKNGQERWTGDHAEFESLIKASNAGTLAASGQRKVGNKMGTHLWSWVDAENANRNSAASFNQVRTAKDLGNVLGGTAFLTVPGQSNGVAYNAEALVDFRTTSTMNQNRVATQTNSSGEPAIQHRIDNYPIDWAVILHDENSIGSAGPGATAGSLKGDYVYGFMPERRDENRNDESRISFNNTWGPTLADGDDYDVSGLYSASAFTPGVDNFDRYWAAGTGFVEANSIAEVEEAIRDGGQNFSSYYFAGDVFDKSGMSKNQLMSWFFAYFPTKFFYGESPTYWGTSKLLTGYIPAAVGVLLNTAKPVALEIWDNEENHGSGSTTTCVTSPCLPGVTASSSIREELALFNVDWIKSFYSNANNFVSGRVVVNVTDAANNARYPFGDAPLLHAVFPMLGYTFEAAHPSMGHYGQWRSMIR